MIGLRRGIVRLYDHETEWELEAQNTISRLKGAARLRHKRHSACGKHFHTLHKGKADY